MLYRRKNSKYWWIMFRDPDRAGKYIRQSTKLTDRAAALEVERSVALGVKRKVDQGAMERILKAVYKTTEGVCGMTLVEAWRQYQRVVEQRGKEQSANTVAVLKAAITQFVDWAREKKGIKLVKQVTSAVAMDFAEFLKKGKVKHGSEMRPVKTKTRKNKIEALSSIWRVLAGIEPEIVDPWRNYVPIVKDGERRQAFTREQEAKVLDAAGKGKLPDWRLISLVARHTGLRKGDVFQLKWEQIDLEKGVIRLTPRKTQNYQIAVAVPMVARLWEEMKRRAEGGMADGTAIDKTRSCGTLAAASVGKTGGNAADAAFGKTQKRSGFVFERFARAYPSDPGVERFHDVLARAGVAGAGYSFHSWRHTFRTRLREAGVPDEIAKQLGGWTRDATLARYNHADETERIRGMMEKMG